MKVFLFLLLCNFSALATEFSAQELQWIADNPNITYVGDPSWFPFEGINDQNMYVGIVADYLALISEDTGLTFNIVPTKSWHESTKLIESGRVDMISETNDSSLTNSLLFTESYISSPIVIVMSNNTPHINGLDQIKHKKIAIIDNYGYTNKITSKYQSTKFIPVTDIRIGLIAVSTGKVDAFLCTIALCSYTLADLAINNVKIVGNTEFDTQLAFGITKTKPELVSIINKAISNLPIHKTQGIMHKWYQNKLITPADDSAYYQATIISIALVTLLILWVYSLNKQIQKRKNIEHQLHESSKQLRHNNQNFELFKRNSPLAYIEWDTNFKVIDWNAAAERVFGYSRSEALHQKAVDLIITPQERDNIDDIWERTKSDTMNNEGIYSNVDKYGRVILCQWHNTRLSDKNGQLSSIISVANDVTESEKAKQQLKHLAYHDELTGLPSLRLGKDRLQQAMASAYRNKLSMAVMFIDLDGFKTINDTFGHAAGDCVIKEIGQRLVSILRNTDTVARIGGDEYMLLLTDMKGTDVIPRIAEKIIHSVTQNVAFNQQKLKVGVSIGITIWRELVTDGAQLIKEADSAMYEAKKIETPSYVIFASPETQKT